MTDSALLEKFKEKHGVSDEVLNKTLEYLENYDELSGMTAEPVDIQTFIEHKDYLNKKGVIYPAIMTEMIELAIPNKYYEAVLTGGIGVAKTTMSIYIIAYNLYLLSLYKDPHKAFGGLDPSSELEIVFQNLSASKAKEVDYERFKTLCDQSPYFTKDFPYDRSLKAKMKFPNRIIVTPVSGSATATIGANVIGGMIDELNYMATVAKSKISQDGEYDQAMVLYNSINRRRKSRFMQLGGKVPGILCLASSTKYPGEFTDVKKEEAKTDKGIFVYHKRIWEVKPDDYGKERFTVFIGDISRKPYILGTDDIIDYADNHLLDYIPEEFRVEFDRDIINSLREIAGHSTLSKAPFFINTNAVGASFGRSQSILTNHRADFVASKVRFMPNNVKNYNHIRWVHLDLARTSDSAGISMGHVDRFVAVDRGYGVSEILPHIVIDFTLEVPPPKNGEIDFATIRRLIMRLREEGINIKFVTADTFQSADALQILWQHGFTTGVFSVDRTTEGYDILKSTIYDDRLDQPDNPHLQQELLGLEYSSRNSGQVVDHPAIGSKDVSDSLAGVVRGLTMQSDIWASHGIPPTNIPQSLQTIMLKADRAMREQSHSESADPFE
jgi:hypothetical protein